MAYIRNLYHPARAGVSGARAPPPRGPTGFLQTRRDSEMLPDEDSHTAVEDGGTRQENQQSEPATTALTLRGFIDSLGTWTPVLSAWRNIAASGVDECGLCHDVNPFMWPGCVE